MKPTNNAMRLFNRVLIRAGIARVDGEGRKLDIHCLRHTFASNYLPVFGAEKTVAQMGHGDYTMLFRHYRALIKEEEARQFWQLTPEALMHR